MTTEKVHVGIDIGTTSAKICAKKGKEVIFEGKRVYETDEIESENGIQNTKLILNTVIGLLKTIREKFENENLQISDIWTCGQMHGIVFWDQDFVETSDFLNTSSLYNWTYSTPNLQNFLKTLPKWNSGEIHPGFGLVTLAYLNNSSPDSLKKYNRCGTIMDLFLTYLTQNSKCFISQHNAFSWGYCSSDYTWQPEIQKFLPNWIELPTIAQDNSKVVGTWNGIRCHVASGDLQASVASLDSFEKTAYIIIGTSAQLCCLVDSNQLSTTVLPSTIVQLPYSDSQKLIAACSMNGGNALESVLKTNADKTFSSDRLCQLLVELDNTVPRLPTNLKIDPIFIPERGVSKELSIQNVRSDTTDIQILEATHEGIINNLFSLFPVSLLFTLSIKTIALVGSSQSTRFRRHIESVIDANFEVITSASAISTPAGAINFSKI
ncbi:hypothetical protein GCK72_010350 [Caenorhabditis remanei]|uniref:Carbohydrate kinase FGGY N-terminal domain-containing protein n=1 Tax=Caenorhabditis remanei TaxID=31234 RepID=A0A6A5H316_CAERE|nr:hypothetical protein GCK72_010350 [Caenorhabditis remanei]KAF1762088.1 hypothetical protein GCK72_010350 [Caenorhabditis remanei]